MVTLAAEVVGTCPSKIRKSSGAGTEVMPASRFGLAFCASVSLLLPDKAGNARAGGSTHAGSFFSRLQLLGRASGLPGELPCSGFDVTNVVTYVLGQK